MLWVSCYRSLGSSLKWRWETDWRSLPRSLLSTPSMRFFHFSALLFCQSQLQLEWHHWRIFIRFNLEQQNNFISHILSIPQESVINLDYELIQLTWPNIIWQHRHTCCQYYVLKCHPTVTLVMLSNGHSTHSFTLYIDGLSHSNLNGLCFFKEGFLRTLRTEVQ